MPPKRSSLTLRISNLPGDRGDPSLRNPAAGGKLAEKAWACVRRNRDFQRLFASWKSEGPSDFFVDRIGVKEVCESLWPHARGKRYDVETDWPGLPRRAQRELESLVEWRERGCPYPVPQSVRDIALDHVLSGPEFDREVRRKYTAVLTNFAARMGHDALEHRYFQVPARIRDPDHRKQVLADFEKFLGAPASDRPWTNGNRTSVFGTFEQWRDFLSWEFLVSACTYNRSMALHLATLLGEGEVAWADVLTSKAQSIELLRDRDLRDVVSRRRAEYDKRIKAVTREITGAVDALFPHVL